MKIKLSKKILFYWRGRRDWFRKCHICNHIIWPLQSKFYGWPPTHWNCIINELSVEKLEDNI